MPCSPEAVKTMAVFAVLLANDGFSVLKNTSNIFQFVERRHTSFR